MNKELRVAYLAGVFDGEGTVGFYFMKGTGRTGLGQWVISTSVSMCCKEVLEEFVEVFDGKIYPCNRKGGVRPVYNWQLKVSRVEPFLQDIIPYLIEKKEQALLAIEIRDLQRTLKRGWREEGNNVIQIESYVSTMKALKRG